MAFDETFSGSPRKPIGLGSVDRLDAMLLKAVDLSLAGCLLVVPLLMGGREALGQLVLVALVVAASLAWSIRQTLRGDAIWRRSAGEWLLAAGVLLLIAQMAVLPPSLYQRLAPHTSQILPVWNAAPDDASAALGPWRQISLTPAATRAGLVLFLAYALLFLVTVQRVRGLEDVERLLRWCAASAVSMAVFGLLQLALSNGKFFWVYEHPYSTTFDAAKGAFANRNHFAHFLALGIGPLVWWVQHTRRRRKESPRGDRTRPARSARPAQLKMGFRTAALGVVLLAGLLSLSRGGAVAIFLAVLVSVLVCYRAGALDGRLATVLGTVALLIGLSLTAFDMESTLDRIEQPGGVSLDSLDESGGRRTIWTAVLKAIPDYALWGSGVGSFREVYPMYLEWQGAALHYTHCENGPLQVALETGLVGLALLLLGVLVVGCWCLGGLWAASGSRRTLVLVGAVTASLCASLAHSLVDFVWYVPACTAMVAVLAACACRLRQLARGKVTQQTYRTAVARPVAFLAVGAVLTLAAWMIPGRVGPVVAERHWHRFCRLERAATAVPPSQGETAEEERLVPTSRDTADDLALPGTEPTAAASSGSLASAESTPGEPIPGEETANTADRKMAAELEEVVRWDPNHARAHLRLAGTYLRLFHEAQENGKNMMPLSQVRDAAIQAEFPSREALDAWLLLAVGEHYRYLDLSLRHARRGLRLCPLLGEGYLFLGELCFLEGSRNADKAVFVDQALRVRPYDGTVLFHAGREAWLAGDDERGLDFWRRSFRSGPAYQRQLIEWMAGRTNPDALDQEIGFLIDTFEPDYDGLRTMYHRYRRVAEAERITPLLMAVAKKAVEEAGRARAESRMEDASECWLEAMVMSMEMKDFGGSLYCAEQAAACNPSSFRARYKLGHLLADCGRLAEAEKHLDWCYQRKPNHIPLRNLLREVKTRLYDRDGILATPPSWRPSITR
jgi:O-antigen ligase/tetratricopeptide (TPR) repeat protein